MSSSSLSWEQVCRQGDQAQVSDLLPGQSHYSRSLGLEWASLHNNLPAVQFLIDKGANDWNRALAKAAQGGHLPLVELFIDKGANDWNWALACAARGGHLPVAQLLIECGANDWNWALACAARGGYLPLVQFFIGKGANNWNRALVFAASGGHLPLAQFFIDKGADEWNNALANAASDGHLPLVQLLIECGATEWTCSCVSLLEKHPDAIIAIFQTGKVPRERFAQHAPAFEQQIVAFLEWQRETSLYLYDTCLLPHELCALIVSY
jgi:ankyrin repeat protein